MPSREDREKRSKFSELLFSGIAFAPASPLRYGKKIVERLHDATRTKASVGDRELDETMQLRKRRHYDPWHWA